ncbi:MAG TPA: hypothetical protein PLG41_24215 [Leptospiraceae bacterium]|jgi:hypothetical protein|nr:hypothetical protein [Leptospiraceae bacterium]
MSEEKKVPNPYGRKGGLEHQAKVEEVAKEVGERGFFVRLEYLVSLVTGKKRFMDVAGLDEETRKPVEFHQIGKETKSGNPVKRERDVLDEIARERDIILKFHAYNVEEKNEE